MTQNGAGPRDTPELFQQTHQDTIQVRQIEPDVAAVELQQQVEQIKRQLAALEEARCVPQDVLELVVSI